MRYLPLTERDRHEMLDKICVKSADEFFADVPAAAQLKGPLQGLPNHASEYIVERHLVALAAKNVAAGSCPSFLGAGAYRHHVPASVDHMLLRGEFLTSYTPYQAEVSQGTLQYLFEFQTQVAMLTSMDIANASMYDGSTASSEAVLMANRITKRSHVILSGNLHPHYRDVITTMAKMTEFACVALPPSLTGDEDLSTSITDATSCVVVQNPDIFGHLHDYTDLARHCHDRGALLIIVVTEIVSLGCIKAPGQMDADIVVGEGQSIGNGLNFGGPHVGLFACREKFLRQMPGRLCGQTVDTKGRRGFVLTLSAREQQIRREKATSNICTNSGLCALAFTIHLSLLGEDGLRELAELNHAKTCQLAAMLSELPGFKIINQHFFNEFTLELPVAAEAIVNRLADQPLLAGVPLSRFYPDDKMLSRMLLLTATELTTEDDMKVLARALQEACQ